MNTLLHLLAFIIAAGILFGGCKLLRRGGHTEQMDRLSRRIVGWMARYDRLKTTLMPGVFDLLRFRSRKQK